MKIMILGVLLAAVAAPAFAQEEPHFCPTRPSLGGSNCTTEPGQVHLEFSTLDWQRDDRSDQREDRVVAADLLARIGVGKDTEVQFGWTAFGHDRTRDKATGQVDRVDGTGDLTFAVREHLVGKDGQPFSAGIQPFVTAPTGRYPVGAGTWSAGAIIPIEYDLTEKLALDFTGEAQAAANQSGDGRHLSYSGIGGLQYKLSERVSLVEELSVERDNDPSGHETHLLAASSIAWRPAKRFQLDLLGAFGLNRTSPDVRVISGGAILF